MQQHIEHQSQAERMNWHGITKPSGNSPMTVREIFISLALAAVLPLASHAADAQRQADVATRGKDVMPFSLKATTHVFTKTAEGGTQRVVAKAALDSVQIKLVRQHLKEIQQQFRQGDFSGPTHIHGQEMSGLAELKAAKPGEIAIDYRNVTGGAELLYKTANATLVTALHKWFDSQLSDHGADAMEGHG